MLQTTCRITKWIAIAVLASACGRRKWTRLDGQDGSIRTLCQFAVFWRFLPMDGLTAREGLWRIVFEKGRCHS